MRILQLGRFYPPSIGGIETVMYDTTEVLNEYEDVSCNVLCSSKNYTYEENSVGNYQVIRTKSLGTYFSTSITPQMIFKLKKIINNYDIIHVHLPDPMANVVLMLVDCSKQKIILHWHSDIVKQRFLLKFYEPFQEWMMRKADKIIATTPKYIEESKYLQKYKDKCISIPIGIDIHKLQKNDEKVLQIKEKYKNKKIIFSLGRLVYYKGFEYLIDSAKYLTDEYVILIGGSGPLKESLQNQIINNGLESKVNLLGRLEDDSLGSYYEACDIYCLSSIVKSEAFGIVQIEAMSFSKPIVATKINGSGVDWVNKNHVSGINVNPKDSKELATSFNKLILNNDLYKQYSKGAKNRFDKLFNRGAMVDSIYNLYKEILK
jgi:glycosyltransferase involved in cell wall biosynthesis